jgi:hypothetical protein
MFLLTLVKKCYIPTTCCSTRLATNPVARQKCIECKLKRRLLGILDHLSKDSKNDFVIESYFERLSMEKIAKKLDRSAATIHAQTHSHDESIVKMGYCVECRRLKGKHRAEKTGNRFASNSQAAS